MDDGESFYSLTEEERTFFRQQTGIPDDEELKAHLLRVQAEAYEIYPNPCLAFARFKMNTAQTSYPYVLEMGQSDKRAIFLDIGSCLGTDARKLVADGYPLDQVVTTDLSQEFANLGHKLFKTTQETYPIAFVPGDIFDPKHLKIVAPRASPSSEAPTPGGSGPAPSPAPDLRSLTSLNPLHGRVSVIHASVFFYQFSEEKQRLAARALAGLLSPEPGSRIFGMQVGAAEPQSSMTGRLFFHSPKSWTKLWDGIVFRKGMVKVQARLVRWERKKVEPNAPQNMIVNLLTWSVTRL